MFSAAVKRGFWIVFIASAMYILAGNAGCAGLVVMGFVALRIAANRWPGSGTTHGDAAFASLEETKSAGMHNPDAVVHLGEQLVLNTVSKRDALVDFLVAPIADSPSVMRNLSHAFGKPEPPARVSLPRVPHASLFGASGCGKGAGILIPTLLKYPGPVVVLDPKGENFDLTAKARRAMGRNPRRVDPWHVISAKGGACINPMSWLDAKSPFVPDIAKDLASALVVRTGEEKEPFFANMSEYVIQAFITATVWGAPIEERNLVTVLDLISNDQTFNTSIKAMQASDAYGGVLRTMGHSIARLEGREKASVLSSVAQHLGFLNSESVRDAVRRTTFDPLDLKRNSCRHDLFLVIPPEKMRSANGFVRYLITGILRRLAQGPPDESREVLLVLDEAATLGNLPILEELVTLMRGWGVRTLFVWQSVSQIQDCFPGDKARTFTANMGAQIFAKTNDLDTAKLVSEMAGDATVINTSTQSGGSTSRPDAWSGGHGGSGQVQRSESWSVSHAETSRRLIKPEEVLKLPKWLMIVFTDCTPPVLVRQVRYYERRFWRSTRPLGRTLWRRFTRSVAVSIAALVIVIAFGTALDRQKQATPKRPIDPPLPFGENTHGQDWRRPR